MIRITLISAALWLGLAPSATALPPTTDLFGCPLLNTAADAAPGEGWRDTALKGSQVIASHPAGWSADQDGSSLTLEAPDGRAWMSLRWGRAGHGADLDLVRRDVELFELGPTHLTPRCEARCAAWIREGGNWTTLRLSVTRRAFGMKRRSFALFASYAGGTITAIVTVKWRKRSEEAVTLARDLLSRLRVDPAAGPSAGRARGEGAPQG